MDITNRPTRSARRLRGSFSLEIPIFNNHHRSRIFNRYSYSAGHNYLLSQHDNTAFVT